METISRQDWKMKLPGALDIEKEFTPDNETTQKLKIDEEDIFGCEYTESKDK